MPSFLSSAAVTAVALASSMPALAAPSPSPDGPSFWDDLGASLGYGRWDSSVYTSEGLATRIRWEPLEHFGLDLTSDFLSTEGAGAKAFDIPIGFHLYVPFELGWGVRVRALAGLCVDVSLARQAVPGTTASDDVRLGFRLGGGAEVRLGGRFWAFLDTKWERYLGHASKGSVWSAGLDGELDVSDRLAVSIGLGVNL